jgi:hypothetical protein
VERTIAESKGNRLRVPLPDGAGGEDLARAFAPVIFQDVAESFDRIGEVTWKGEQVEVIPEKPTVYYYFSHAFLNGEPILQINYVFWFEARGGSRAPSIERGHLDGLTIRFSLDPQGKIFMVDGINNCGCYHFFAPDSSRVEQVLSPSGSSSPFVPQALPPLGPGERLGLRINSGWHQVQRLLAVKEAAESISYKLIPYSVLETLHRDVDRRKSMFDGEGVVKGTERFERFILFPMGVPRIGSMRQRGHHAIDFIGRVHFDDPDLFERNFILK